MRKKSVTTESLQPGSAVYFCVRCGQAYYPQTYREILAPTYEQFCPYCESVMNGKKDVGWIPLFTSWNLKPAVPDENGEDTED